MNTFSRANVIKKNEFGCPSIYLTINYVVVTVLFFSVYVSKMVGINNP